MRQRKYERQKAILTMKDTADQLNTVIKERIRQINTSFEEIKAQRENIEAEVQNLDALEATEQLKGRITPAFLQTKLAAQEQLALAYRAELQAITQYNVAMVELAQAKGTVLELHGVKTMLPEAMGKTAEVVPVKED